MLLKTSNVMMAREKKLYVKLNISNSRVFLRTGGENSTTFGWKFSYCEKAIFPNKLVYYCSSNLSYFFDKSDFIH